MYSSAREPSNNPSHPKSLRKSASKPLALKFPRFAPHRPYRTPAISPPTVSSLQGSNQVVPITWGPQSAPSGSTPHAHAVGAKPCGVQSKKPSCVEEVESTSVSASSDAYMTDRIQLGGRSGKARSDDRDLESGQCATCGSKVRWPKGLHEFRCATCLMINDLTTAQSRTNTLRDHAGAASSRSGIFHEKDTSGRGLSLTLERTRTIMNHCIDTYLDYHRHQRNASKHRTVSTPPRSPALIQEPLDGFPSSPEAERVITAQNDDSFPVTPPDELSFTQAFTFGSLQPTQNPPSPVRNVSEKQPRYLSPPRVPTGSIIPRKPVANPVNSNVTRKPPARKPPPAPTSLPLKIDQRRPAAQGLPVESQSPVPANGGVYPRPRIPAAQIFRPLEDYIVRSFGDQESLNSAFSRGRARPPVSARSEEKVKFRREVSPPRNVHAADLSLSGVDAKTLLLGDVAENGLWWTGRQEPSAPTRRRKSERVVEPQQVLVNSRSPLINWSEVDAWYSEVLEAGHDWQERWRSLTPASPTSLHNNDAIDRDAADIGSSIAEARAHLHKALLRVSETVLKRPGRPLREPSDVRFLLIMLANPLLHPSPAGSRAHAGEELNSRGARSLVPPREQGLQHSKVAFDSAWDQGSAFGILKRTFGLLSNLSPECHRNLTTWLAKYDEQRFCKIVELLQRFVTYRLKRLQGRKRGNLVNPAADLIPNLTGTHADTSARLHAALGLSGPKKSTIESQGLDCSYADDWQIRAAARVMSLAFAANKIFQGARTASSIAKDEEMSHLSGPSRTHIKHHGQLLSTSDFYSSMIDLQDVIADFDQWETSKTRFAFCQYPFFLSVGSKIKILEHDAKRQMEVRAREAFFNNLLKNESLEQYLTLKVRRDCLVGDSLTGISEVVGAGQEDIKKGLKVQFVGEEGIDAGGLKKEWFLLLAREIFDPHHALFNYDEDSRLCYFNPHSFETSDQFFLVGALLGLAIYNSIILDVALPPFTFKKLLMSAGGAQNATRASVSHMRPHLTYTLNDLAEYRPSLAKGLQQLLDFSGDVEATFSRDFTISIERYGTITNIPLCENGATRPVTNANRVEFVDLYVRYLLDTAVARQFEPFKRGFFNVCGGNALSLFQPEEIELLVRGSAEPLDVPSLRAVAVYENWTDPVKGRPLASEAAEAHVPLLQWFWELFEEADVRNQRKLLSFVTSSDRIPAVGAASLVIKIAYAGKERDRFPIARTCFNLLLIFGYRDKRELGEKLWGAVWGSEGFGLR